MHGSLSGVVVLALGSLLLGACTADAPGPSSPARSVGRSDVAFNFDSMAARERGAAVAGRGVRGIEDEILRFEDKVPGFGGLFVDSTGTVVVYAPAEMSVETARATVREHAGEFTLLPEHQEQLTAGDRVRVLPAAYAFSRLLAWEQALASTRQLNDNIVSYDANEGVNRVDVGVVDSAAAAEVFRRAASLGIPHEAIVTHHTGYAIGQSAAAAPLPEDLFLKGKPPADSFLTDAILPMRGGLQIAIDGGDICTLGFITSSAANQPTEFVTASHCAFPIGGGPTGAHIYQPAVGSGMWKAKVVRNPAFHVVDAACGSPFSGTACTWADVLVAGGVVYGIAAYPIYVSALNSTKITGTQTIYFIATPYQGMSVTRTGKSTGTTSGSLVDNTCMTVNVNFPSGYQYINLCGWRVAGGGGGDEGDSGGPVYSGANAVGIHFAGTGPGCSPCYTWFNTFASMRRMIGVGNPY